jgi:hypothetical protein
MQNVDEIVSIAKDIKAPLTDKELEFIQLHLIHNVSMDQAMISIGYGRFSPQWRNILARRILIKYETRAQDRRILFRELGAGEVEICQGLLDLARNARSEAVRRAAWADLASCLGLKAEQIESFQGVSLNVISVSDARKLGYDVPGDKPGEPEKVKSIMITK